ncbi:MAG: preprotein translocase subunit SecG [Lentisphaeria bacterium]|nr:preprotein translocase subunit SecG [Lentisphaeria bacterium]MBR7127101.1 preprotein translocase subunit SecG [Lentisphaeria bacterium]
MAVWTIVLYVAVILVALMLIALILVQQSKSGGLGGTFGGVGESLMGGQAGSHLTKATVWLTVVFFILILLLAMVISRGWAVSDDNKEINQLLSEEVPAQVEAVEKAADEAVKKVEETKK